jgi:hypothetical protein
MVVVMANEHTEDIIRKMNPAMAAMSEMVSSQNGAGTHELEGCAVVLMHNKESHECAAIHLPDTFCTVSLNSLLTEKTASSRWEITVASGTSNPNFRNAKKIDNIISTLAGNNPDVAHRPPILPIEPETGKYHARAFLIIPSGDILELDNNKVNELQKQPGMEHIFGVDFEGRMKKDNGARFLSKEPSPVFEYGQRPPLTPSKQDLYDKICTNYPLAGSFDDRWNHVKKHLSAAALLENDERIDKQKISQVNRMVFSDISKEQTWQQRIATPVLQPVTGNRQL